jgi:hypothetical protein
MLGTSDQELYTETRDLLRAVEKTKVDAPVRLSALRANVPTQSVIQPPAPQFQDQNAQQEPKNEGLSPFVYLGLGILGIIAINK